MNDTVSDFFIRIKNASMARQNQVVMPYSGYIEQIAKVLQKEGFVLKTEKKLIDGKEKLVLLLTGEKKTPKIEIKLISKPGKRVYMKSKDLLLFRGLWTVIVSTPQGVMSAKEAIAKSTGGEIICKIIK